MKGKNARPSDKPQDDELVFNQATAVPLPSSWRCTTVGESITIIDYRGRTPPFDGDSIPHLRSQNVKAGRIVWDDLVYVSSETYTRFMTRGIPVVGDLLFTTEAPLGEVAPVPDRKFSLAQRLMVLRPSRNHWQPSFLMYQLMSPDVQARLRLRGTGSTVTGVSSRNFKPMTLNVAPLDEQKRIVAEIEKQFTRLETGVAALKRVQANLKRYRAAVLKAACEGRLVTTEAELAKTGKRKGKFETGEQLLARILEERRKKWNGKGKYKEPAEPDVTGLPELPEGWGWATIGTCFHVAVGATPSRQKSEYWGGNIPWVSSGEVRFAPISDTRETITAAGLQNSSTQLNPAGSVLLGMIGEGKTRGQTAVLKMDACNNQNCAAIWVSQTPMPPEYVHYWLWSQYDNTRLTSSGNNQPALNKARVEAMLLPIPPLAEQVRIVAEVERRLSVVEELETVVTANLQRAQRLRQAILQKAFRGELV